jgi:hypothetical protein
MFKHFSSLNYVSLLGRTILHDFTYIIGLDKMISMILSLLNSLEELLNVA